jgi:hypothetical protein
MKYAGCRELSGYRTVRRILAYREVHVDVFEIEEDCEEHPTREFPSLSSQRKILSSLETYKNSLRRVP